MDRRVQFLQTQLEREAIPARPLESAMALLSTEDQARSPMMMEELSRRLQEHEERVKQMNTSQEALQKRLLELEEAKNVIRETEVFFQQAEAQPEAVRVSMDTDAEAPLLENQGQVRPNMLKSLT